MFYTTGRNRAAKIYGELRKRKEQEGTAKEAAGSQDIPETDFAMAVERISTDAETGIQQ